MTLSLEYVHDLLAFFGVFGKAANLTCNQVFPIEKDVIMQKRPAWFPGQRPCSDPAASLTLLTIFQPAIACLFHLFVLLFLANIHPDPYSHSQLNASELVNSSLSFHKNSYFYFKNPKQQISIYPLAAVFFKLLFLFQCLYQQMYA